MLKKKRAGLISVLATAFVATMAFAGITANQAVASAAGENNVFVMENGASLKISEEGGIRFRVQMDEAQKNYITENDNVTLHFVVAPNEFFNAVPAVNGVYDYYNKLSKKIVINVDETKIYEENGAYWANGCLTNVYAANRNLDFTMLAYTHDASTDAYDYADAELSNVRGALTDVLSQAVVYTDAQGTSYTEDVFECGAYNWFGTEEYPIQINNLETYNNLVSKVNGGAEFSAYTINVSDKVPTEGREAFDEGKTVNVQNSCVVKFCYADGTLYKKYVVKEGETISVPNGPAGATDQYVFAGWDIDEDGKADKVDTTIMNSATYTAVYEKAYEIMPEGVQKIPGSNGEVYRHAFVGLTTDLDVGTTVEVTMEVFVTAASNKINEQASIKWVDTVWSSGGEVKAAPNIVDYATMTENEGKWIKVSFFATVRNFAVLRSGTQYEKIDTSAYGNAVYLMASNFMSGPSFNYRNVEMTEVNAMPEGTEKTQNANGYRQAIAGLSTNFAVGTTVAVEMDVYVTGMYDQYSTGIVWVDTVHTTAGGESNATTKLVSVADMDANVGKWIHLSFNATVRNFDVLRLGTEYEKVDTSAYGNAVFLMANGFKSADSFIYKNVEMTEVNAMPTAVGKIAGNARQYTQSFVGLSTNFAEGTAVTVEMDIYITGTYDQWSNGIYWVDTVWTTSGGELNATTKIVSVEMMDANKGKWIHVTFDATVRNFAVLRLNDKEYATMDTSAYGNAVYLAVNSFTSAASFNYKNVVIKAK